MEGIVGIKTKQYVIFSLSSEECGIDIQKVTSIEQVKPIARVPKTPKYIKGVLNLRGDIIPIMDLRVRFGLPQTEETEETRIIIINIEGILLGLIADTVAEVLQFSEESIENVSGFQNELSLDYIQGVGKVDNRIATLLNIDKLANLD